MMRWVLVGLAMAMSAGAAPAPLSLKDVMRRAGAYVDGYGDKASIVVCTENYEQHASGQGTGVQTRTLVSDFALVYADAIEGWLGFRDVLAVDGSALQDREGRLARVLMGAEGRFDEARRLSDENARFNLGNVHRNFNTPTSALFFFSSRNLDRFRFAAGRVMDDGTWEITFKETGKPTLIRTPEGDPVPTNGTIWVRPDDGVVVRTVLEMETLQRRLQPPRRGTGHIDVQYRRIDSLDMWLPASMDEAFGAIPTRGDGWDKVDGHAEYSNYRRFETSGRIKK